jgi:RNA recognition motif-containing protein
VLYPGYVELVAARVISLMQTDITSYIFRRTLFLRNCPEKPEDTLKEELKTLFAECGKVEQVSNNYF